MSPFRKVISFFRWLIGRPADISIRQLESNNPQTTHYLLKATFLDAFHGAIKERARQKDALLNDAKLRKHFKKAFQELAKEVANGKTGYILLGSYDIGIATDTMPIFFQIFRGVCNELGIKATKQDSEWIHVDVASLKAAVDALNTIDIDVEERIRAMLHSGSSPYR